ncbi:hypothetical protein PsorP6_006374 [Peronosclerospora sorghi]|uniref:Uncharacterized protein n=1 Tax=Peronosclerospora sorghi TaxID=230839 RepID=A0ACC0W2S4_9STRA|nr:hypothetical protein PsorP6_006374 [Peronosclerospora sorghi]
MQLQLIPADDLVVPSSYRSTRNLLTAPQRAERSRQRHCVAFDHETIALRQAFRTAPEPVRVDAPLQTSPCSILRTRSTSATMTGHSVESHKEAKSESTEAKQLLKKKKKVSFVQMDAEHEVEPTLFPASSEPCSCGRLAVTANIKDLPSPIHAACRRVDLSTLKYLLSFYFGADLIKLVNSTCACGRTPLEVACETGNVKIVKLLLKRHADPNGGGRAVAGAKQTLACHIRNHRRRVSDPMFGHKPRQRTCVGIACQKRTSHILGLLMQYGARIDEDALVTAARHGYEDVITTVVTFATTNAKKRTSPVHQFFHKKGAEANERLYVPLISRSAMQKACSAAASEHAGLIRVLLGDGHTSLSREKIITCAFDAVNLPDYRLLKCLTKMYDSALLLNARDKISQSSLLHVAVKNGSEKTVFRLLKMGADVQAQDGSGISPLYLACARGQEAVVQALLDKGATCSAVGPSGETPLHIAAQENQLACVELLLEHARVPVDDVTVDRCTALHLASQRGNTAVAARLLDFGANVDAMTVDNESPLLKASRMSQFQTVKLLLARNASPQPVLTSSTSEPKLKLAESPQLSRTRSCSSSANDRHRKSRKRSERLVKSNTHASLKHWLCSMLNN